MKNALITGIGGQDGSYLAELLLEKGYKVFGTVTQRATPNHQNIKHILNDITLITADMTDSVSLKNALKVSQPSEVYNLAAQSSVGASWAIPVQSSLINGLGVLRLLENFGSICPNAKFFQASTSEMFGNVSETPQTEETPFRPKSPYGIAKLYGHWIATNYRESYGLYSCSGILFNHESIRRGDHFLTQKVAKAVARIKLGLQKELVMGNLDSQRDIGHAKDYVRAMWLMLQQNHPEDYVISSGITHSIREIVDFCFKYVDLDYKQYVKQSGEFFRPVETELLLGDSSKIKNNLGWEVTYNYEEIMSEMIENQLKLEKENV